MGHARHGRHGLTASAALAAGLLLFPPTPAAAADLTVNTLADNAVGGDGFCTLREAITAANGNADFNDCAGAGAYGVDAIAFSVPGTIVLGSILPGIEDSAGVTIDGGGNVTISGNHAVGIFQVDFGGSLSLRRLTLANGARSIGGAIDNPSEGTLHIEDSTLSDSTADEGGAIRNHGTLTIINTTFSRNTATELRGGALFHVSGLATIENCRFVDNAAHISGGAIANSGGLVMTGTTLLRNTALLGGGLYLEAGSPDVSGSTFAFNTATMNVTGGDGGGINNEGILTLTNTTLSGNAAFDAGGAIRNFGTLTATNVTISGNGSIDAGGSISNSGTATFASSIIANAVSGGHCAGAVVDGGYNIEDTATCGFAAVHHSQPNTDPLLDPAGLEDNGGLTDTISLQTGSPAIDAIPGGANGCGVTITRDQRGTLRPSPPPPSLGGCDIGAYEKAPGFAFDSDDDGVPNGRDRCPRSDLRHTVVVNACNSGVPNRRLTGRAIGCTIGDLIAEVDRDTSTPAQFAHGVARLTSDLVAAGLITSRQKVAIQHCATHP